MRTNAGLLKQSPARLRPLSMYLDPRALLMLVVLVGVTGYVAKGLLVTWYRLSRAESPGVVKNVDVEERLRKVEAAMSSLLVDMTSMREKERFMARLQAKGTLGEKENDVSPMVTQSVPAIPRIGSQR